SGKADVIQLGRQSLADPDLPIKAMTGKEDEIARCMRCFTCFSNSSQAGVFYCAINPKIGHERENMYDTPPYSKKKVLVAGGGIGGMQAAITCAERGHEVILCEKTDKLGGVLHCEINIPFKSKLESYISLQTRKISRLPIDVRLNTPVTPELAESIAPDVIIAAMGSRPVKPPIKGIDLPKVRGAEEIYYHPELAGKKVVILGGGLVGLELGVFLAMEKRDVTIVEMMPRTLISPNDPTLIPKSGEAVVQGFAIRDLVEDWDNYTVLTSTKALEVNDEGLVVEGPDGVKTIPADTVIYAVGQKSVRDEAIALAPYAAEFHMIGDSVAPKNILAATQAAYQIARDIGRY
ncbi:MAG: FAD-dependent oxidoreductase, partial [Oscillospiraceae bacterium]|nr:FAD-dependent oxidoreductase [Oscillospiraceae bacterium]